MKIDARFPGQIAAALVVIAVAAAYPLWRFAPREIIVASAVGAALSTINVLLGYLAIEYSFDKSYTTFLKVVLGGMGLRMVFLLAALLILIKVFMLHAVGLTVSLLAFYVVFLTLEVMFIQKKLIIKNQG